MRVPDGGYSRNASCPLNLISMFLLNTIYLPTDLIWFFDFGVWRHFQQYFNYIMETSFSSGRSRSTRREPRTIGKQMINHMRMQVECSLPTEGRFDRSCMERYILGCACALFYCFQIFINRLEFQSNDW